jgi:Pyridoxamine 5'-phosphate oxidase
MKKDPETLAAAKKAINTAKILKGQYVSIATCDAQGVPNVAPIGSLRIVDENTAHVLQGFLFQSYKNLEGNPKAAFAVCFRPKLGDFFKLFKGSGQDAMGYQVYGELLRVDDSQAAVEQEYRQMLPRMPFFLRRLFLRFCRANLKRLLAFQITGVRKIGTPS